MARHPLTKDCGVTGCARAQYRGLLCSKHHALIPKSETMACAVACMSASHAVAEEYHRAWLTAANALVEAGLAA